MYRSYLTLEVANVHLKTIEGSHLDGKKVVVILLELLVEGVLREEQLGEILKVVDQPWT